jgi:hypothetical protein
MKWKGCGWEWLWPNLKYDHDIFIERLRKAMHNLSQDIQSLGQYLNPGSPECDAGVLTT